MRAKVWIRETGNSNSLTVDLFNLMVERGERLRSILLKVDDYNRQREELSYQVDQLKSKLTVQTEEQSSGGSGEGEDVKAELEAKESELALVMTQLEVYTQQKALVMGVGTNSKEESIKLIDTDIPRTFSQENLFADKSLFAEKLRKVLEAFAMYRPDIGYVQSMSYIGGIVLMLTSNDFGAFVLFHNIITKSALYPFYKFDDTYTKQRIIIYKQILGLNL